ncbi:MAG: DUF1206 domain-containing protein [Ilumatobacteraceae bacterium]
METTLNDDATSDHDSDVGVERAEEFARDHPGLVRFARIGWAAKGIVYGLTGVLAVLIGLRAWRNPSGASAGGAESEASQTGAIARIAETSFGVVLLIVMAVGLVIYSTWRLVTVVLPADNGLKGWVTRFGYFVSAIVYLTLAFTAVSFARNPGKPADGEDSKVESFTRELMDKSGGRIAVFLIGAVVIVIAAAFLYKAIGATFRSQLFPGGVGPVSQEALVILGRIGWVGRSGMMALIGFFLARAAVRFDPDDAQGLDGSLRNAASSGPGAWLVIAVGAGLLVYGVFCALSAPKRRLVGADS